jgi:hypothetical protein
MPQGKRWTVAAEETSLAKAFLAATKNPFLAHISAVNEQVKKRNSSVFTLGTTVFALKGNNNPDAAATVNDCIALLIKKAHATIDEDTAGGNEEQDNSPSENTSDETPTEMSELSM